MTKEETSKVLALFSIAGVKFEGDKNQILALWSECLVDMDAPFVFKAVKDLIKKEKDLFSNGLIAKVRDRAKLLKDLNVIEQNLLEKQKQIEDKNDIRRIGSSNK